MTKKTATIAIAIALAITTTLTGCSEQLLSEEAQREAQVLNDHNAELDRRFGDHNHTGLIVDQETGVTYLTYHAEKKFGITALLESDGTPHIDETWAAEHPEAAAKAKGDQEASASANP